MKTLKLLALLMLGACASEQRTKWSDKGMQIMIDPEGLEEGHYAEIQTAIMEDGNFNLVDRGQAFSSIKAEQERTHIREASRFENKQKYAHLGKLYGVGSIVVARVQCAVKGAPFSVWGRSMLCKQYLSLVDTNTAKVLAAVSAETEGPTSHDEILLAPDWKDAVAKLSDKYEKTFTEHKISPTLVKYQQDSEANALSAK